MSLKLAVYSTKSYDKTYLDAALASHQAYNEYPARRQIDITYHPFPLGTKTAPLASGHTAICAFVNDTLNEPVLRSLHAVGVRAILLRCAGYNNVDLGVAEELGLSVSNVPSYSPEAVAEFAVTLLQSLNRKTHRAYNRVREGNFNLEGLMGVTLVGKTVGVVGLGRIGLAFARIVGRGFGCRVLVSDPFSRLEGEELREECGGSFVELRTLLAESDFVSLHCPLTPGTRHIIDAENLGHMKKGALLVNTSRGALVNAKAAIDALKSGKLGGLALDVYEEEAAYFYNDHSGEIIADDTLMRLMTFPNVLVRGHQAFFTAEALGEISGTVMANLEDWIQQRHCPNSLIKEKTENKQPVRI